MLRIQRIVQKTRSLILLPVLTVQVAVINMSTEVISAGAAERDGG